MSDLLVSASFTISGGDAPATGLTLSDISLYLNEIDRATGAETIVWDGTENPTDEATDVGAYYRIYTGADLDENVYFGGGLYTGASTLDNDWVTGAVTLNNIPIGTAEERDYQTIESDGTPIQGVIVHITTDLLGTNVIWQGTSDTFGYVRDSNSNKPRLDAGTYYFWRQKPGYIFDDPDTEVFT